jgi:transcriptional antiterminator RfaH
MPVLAAEPDVYPIHLFTNRTSTDFETRGWWLLHTRPRQEKAIARHLHANQVPFYLPLVSRRWTLRGRPVSSYLPLFPGYLFLLGNADERLLALGTRRVASALSVSEQARLWGDLQQVHRLIASGQPITAEDKLAPGQVVEIRSGPLAGLRGKIVQQASRRRFVVEVDFIQRGASVLLDDFALASVA